MKNERAFITKCYKALIEWEAPLEGWKCVGVHDYEKPEKRCELCGCQRVRFLHEMHHEGYDMNLFVCWDCAGLLEGNELAAEKREHKMRDRAARRKRFLKLKWKKTGDYSWNLVYRGKEIRFSECFNGQYIVDCNRRWATHYHGKPIMDFRTATYAVFELADPPIKAKRR